MLRVVAKWNDYPTNMIVPSHSFWDDDAIDMYHARDSIVSV